MSRKAWTFYDSIEDETYIFPVNPNADEGSNAISKTIGYAASVANYVDISGIAHIGSNVIFASPDEQMKFAYSGLIYSKEQYRDMERWSSLPYAIEMTDDLSRTFSIYIETFSTSRVRSRNFPWKHSYKIAGLILAEV